MKLFIMLGCATQDYEMERPKVGTAGHSDGSREIVYVVGWPKSGCTWLARLLGDALNCPVGGTMGRKDYKEIATEGWNRPAPYVVRKTHFVLIDEDGPLVPRPHRLNWKRLTTERVIYIVRDPRDIAVSMAFYFEYSLDKALQQLRVGWRMPIEGGWVKHIEEWQDVSFPCIYTSFEALLENGKVEMARILREARLPTDEERIANAVERQSFANRKQHIVEQGEKFLHGEPHAVYLRGTEWQLTFMRKGIAGDWKNHFTRKHGKRAQRFFGPTMKRLGYIKKEDWWKSL